MKIFLRISLYIIIGLSFVGIAFGDSISPEEFKKFQEESKIHATKNPQSYIKVAYAGIDLIVNDSKEQEFASVYKGLPADLAGIQQGDIIIKIDGKLTINRSQTFKMFESKSSGDSIVVDIKRNGKLLKKRVKLETIHLPYDFYIMKGLIAKGIPIRLAVLPGEMKFNHAAHQEGMDQFKEALITKLINLFEGFFIQNTRNQNSFVIVDRNFTKAILNELKFQESGLVSTESRKKIGAILGATHVLIVNYTWSVDKMGEGYALLTRKFIEIESGKILAVVNNDWSLDIYNKKTGSAVKQDLTNYYKKLSTIATLESEVIEKYNSITGTNYKNDHIIYDALINVIIPKYEMFVKQLINISNKTIEVTNLHKIYIEGANYQLQSFLEFETAFKNQDKILYGQANETLSKGRGRLKEWQTSLDDLIKKENLESKK